MMKRNFVYITVNGNKEGRREYDNERTARAAFEYILQQLYETGKSVVYYNARTGERKEVVA